MLSHNLNSQYVINAYFVMFAMNLYIHACIYLINNVSGYVAHGIAKSIDSASISRIRCVRKGHLGRDLVARWSGHLSLSGHVCRQPLVPFARDADLGARLIFRFASNSRGKDATPLN